MPVFGTQMFGSAASGYEIDYSCVFNDDDDSYISRTYGTGGNQDLWTLSFWIKRTEIGTGGDDVETYIFVSGASTSNTFVVMFHPTDVFRVFNYAGSYSTFLQTKQVFRDVSAWYHFVIVYDSAQVTAADRVTIYVNGEEITAFETSIPGAGLIYPDQNEDSIVGSNVALGFGRYISYGAVPGDYYLAEINYANGTAEAVTAFGETNDDGVWIPKKYGGSYGTGGFYLDFADSSDLGKDVSGNGNDFTSSGLAAADQMTDTPNNNHCVMNSIQASAGDFTFSEGNLRTTGGNNKCLGSTFLLQSGKWYWECQTSSVVATNNLPRFGVANGTLLSDLGDASTIQATGGYGVACAGDQTFSSTSDTATSTTVSANDYFCFAYDADAEKLWIGKVVSGTRTWFGASDANVTAGANERYSSVTAPITPAMEGHDSRNQGTDGWNFGQKTFQGNSGSPPTDFNAVNTSNISAPALKDPSTNFQTELYTGDGVAIGSGGKAITFSGNSAMQPDIVWIKNRDEADDQEVWDAARGVTKVLKMNTTDAEDTEAEGVTTFGVDGFTVGSLAQVNTNTEDYVAWCWAAGNSGSSNTTGSINTTTTYVDATAGISISTYTGDGNSGATVGHGLGVTPAAVWVLPRSNGDNRLTNNWEEGVTAYSEKLKLNDSEAPSSNTQITAASSTTFTLGSDVNVNGDTRTYLAYVFAEVLGFSKFGTYTGNGSADGPFMHCGFKPRFIVTKAAQATNQEWIMWDTARNTYNVATNFFYMDTSAAEMTDSDRLIDILSNGAKIRVDHDSSNKSDNAYIFMAFAENPFGGSGVAPATAR